MSIALVFPGQGSQSVGMLAALAARYARGARSASTQASQALGFDLWQLVAEGPAERLNATEIHAAGDAGGRRRDLARSGASRAEPPRRWWPATAWGNSRRWCAPRRCRSRTPCDWCTSAARSCSTRCRRARARWRRSWVSRMREVEAACARGRARRGGRGGQLQLSGPGRDRRACGGGRARDGSSPRQRGAKRAHAAAGQRAGAFEPDARGRPAAGAAPRGRSSCARRSYRYISAVDAAEHSEPADIRATLVRQLASPVRWSHTVRALLRVAPTLIECGPGKVLTGLNRRIERSASCFALEDPDSLAAGAGGDHAPRSGSTCLSRDLALVTGASRGIGRAIALALGGAGATVVGTATTQEGAAQHHRGICAPPASAGRGLVWNATDPAARPTRCRALDGGGGPADDPGQQCRHRA